MATYTSIPAFTSGQVLTSAVMNDVKNNLDLGNAQSAYPYRNLLYNGAMQIAQRGTSTASITTGAFYTADRWVTTINSLGTWTQSVENDAPTGSGLRKSLKMLCTTADAAPASGDYLFIKQGLEGQDLQRVAKGTSSAQTLTLSFWVKANVTGTFIVWLYDVDNTRSVSAAYTVSASATWEKKTLTIPADTTGVWDNDNAESLSVYFVLAAGSGRTSGTLQTAWGSNVDANQAVGQTNLAAATNNYWQITGVQFEVGSVSTPFEFLPYGDELARCQRYYWRLTPGAQYQRFGIGQAYSTSAAIVTIPYPVTPRTAPTGIEQSGTASDYRLTNSTAGDIACNAVPAFSRSTLAACEVTFSVASGLTAGNASYGYANNATAYIGFTGAEL